MTTRKHAFYGILALVSLLGLGITQSARANYIATLQEVGSNVVGSGSGSLDITVLTFGGNSGFSAFMHPSVANLLLGPTTSGSNPVYSGISGPTSFGSGGLAFANTGAGNFVAVSGAGHRLVVPTGYMSGTPLGVSTATWNNETFAMLGVTPGTYTWTWGTGDHADSFTLYVGVPDAGSTLPLLSFALLGVAVLRRKLRC